MTTLFGVVTCFMGIKFVWFLKFGLFPMLIGVLSGVAGGVSRVGCFSWLKPSAWLAFDFNSGTFLINLKNNKFLVKTKTKTKELNFCRLSNYLVRTL